MPGAAEHTPWSELVTLSADQEAFLGLVRTFAAREVRPIAREVDDADTAVPWELWRKAAAAGITGFMLPEELGGGGVTDVLTQAMVQEELCVGDIGLGNLLTSGGFFAGPVLALGTPEQQAHWLRPLAGLDPPLTAVAVTEPDAGSDVASLRTRATRTSGGYLLSGSKTWISNGGVADRYVVFATLSPGSGYRGVTAFLVERGVEGLSFGPPLPKLGQRAIVSCPVFLDDVFVPDEQRLGGEGQGFSGLMRTFDTSRVVLAAAATGLARAALDYAVAYARDRVQFGKPILEHQAVAFRLADAATRIDASRLLVLRAAQALDTGRPASAAAAMAKLYASETAMWVTWAAIQTLGGWGYSREHLVEKWFRDAKLEEIEEGTSDIQRLVISRHLGKR
jgi:acyl-CoA dehydrogenase